MKTLILPTMFLTITGILSAGTLTFEDLPLGECGTIQPVFTEGGYSFNYSFNQAFACVNVANPAGNIFRFSSNGTQTLGFEDANTNTNGYVPLSMYATDGSSFDLKSVDLAQFFKVGDFAYSANAPGVTITGMLAAGGTVSVDLAIAIQSDGPGGHADFATFLLPANFSELSGVTFRPDAIIDSFNESDFMLDNIVVDSDTALPEPATIWLLSAGLAGMAAVLKRRLNAQFASGRNHQSRQSDTGQ